MNMKTTNNNRHTPGPWRVYDNGFFYDVKVPWQGQRQVEDHSPSLCQVFYEGCDGIAGRPNARLIAAAPELLVALESIAQAAIEVKSPEDNERFRAWAFAQARQAVEQAGAGEVLAAPGASACGQAGEVGP